LTADCETTSSGCSNPMLMAETTYSNGTCATPLSNTMNPIWAADLNTPTTRCFLTEAANVTLDFGGILLPLRSAVVAGEWDATPATAVNEGILRGFVRKVDADATDILSMIGVTGLGGNLWLSTLLPGGRSSTLSLFGFNLTIPACRPANVGAPNYERDVFEGQDGWWFYINYTATRLDDWYTP
jgi:hypothetical protein